MNKLRLLFILSIGLFFSNKLNAGTPSMHINSSKGYNQILYNYERFSFYDSLGAQHSGKVYFMNDSEFCFVNYFLERRGAIYHIKDIYEINAGQVYLESRRTIPLGVKIVGAVLVPYVGVIYLAASEIHRASKRKAHFKNGRIQKKDLQIKIKGFAEEV